jgi:tetratricopeptide (TPR) repeat protein
MCWLTLSQDQSRCKPQVGSSDPAGAPPVSPKSALSNLPERNPFFSGRERVLAQLQEALVAQGRAALSGLGGVGKTQTAAEYVHRHLTEYAHTFWTLADSHDSIVSGYGKIAGLLKLPESKEKDQTLAVDAVKRWLGSQERWLLILDNADDMAKAREFIPLGKNGHVLLTTRAHATGAVARRVDIREMGIEEGALFLLRRAKYITEDAPLHAAAEDDQAQAKEIAARLDGLPLALDQAGAYIEETGCGIAGYLELYRSHALELLEYRGELAQAAAQVSDHPDSVGITWALSFANIEKKNPAAADLLRFCAFLHSDEIPEEVFSESALELGPVLGPAGSDVFALNGAIAEILKYSLLRRDSNSRTLEIHRLVQTVLKQKQAMSETSRRIWAERAVRALNRAFPDVEFSNWAVCERLLPQVHTCAELIDQWTFEFPEAGRLLNQAGFYLYERGRYTDAKPLLLLEKALAIREKALGSEHEDVADSLNNLAGLFHGQGQYEKAEPLYQHALSIREKALGLEHEDVANSLNNLAGLYHGQGRYAEAEPLYQRALAIWEKSLGPDDTDVATCLNNLGASYRAQGQYAKAEPLCQRGLAIRERALGPDHPDVANSLSSLAELYRSQKHYQNAQPLYQRALAIREKKLGPDHPFVANSLENYSLLLRDMGRSQEAGPLEARARAIRAKSS